MTGVPILGRLQAKLMNYISYPEIHAPKNQEHQPVSANSLKSTDYVHSLETMGNSLQSKKTAQSMDSLKTTPATNQTAQEEHRNATRVKSTTAHGPKSSLPTTKEYILHEYADIFRGIGTLPGCPYHIKLKDSYKPVQHPPGSVPLGMQSAYKAELDRLVKEGTITEVHDHTEWINSIVPVAKEDGSLRLCLDPEDLNKAIERNQWYARTLDDILPELVQSKYFTVKDATSGFWHVPLDLRSSLLTTFNMPWDKYRWLRMPFGLKVSRDVCQERLDIVLRLVPGVLGIADDIVIHGSTENTHDRTVLILCETARLNNLSLNSKKMQFKSTDCKFLGHRLTPDGIKVNPKRIEAIIQMDPPQNVANLQSFNDMVNYLKKFSPVLSKLSEPLRRLCKSGVNWAWESEQQHAFEAIKQVIMTLPVLAYFDKTTKHTIQCNASKKGLVAVLLQESKPVMYVSRALTKTEQRYSNIERGLLAIVFALERLNHYTFGRTIIVQSDHQPLQSIWKKSIVSTSPRLQRLLLRLAHYDLNIEFLREKQNVIADALSRVCPLQSANPKAIDSNIDVIPVHHITQSAPISKTRLQELRLATQSDLTLSSLAKTVHKGWPQSKKDCPEQLLDFWSFRQEISEEDGLLYKNHRLIMLYSERLKPSKSCIWGTMMSTKCNSEH